MSTQITPDPQAPADTPARPQRPERSKAPKWPLVAKREIAVKLRDRNFIISTVFTLVIIIASMGIQAFIGTRPDESTVGVTSSQGQAVVQQAEQLANAGGDGPRTTYKVSQVADVDTLKKQVNDGTVDSGLIQQGDQWVLLGKSDKNGKLQENVTKVVSQQAIERNAKAAGTNAQDIFKGSTVGYELTQSGNDEAIIGKVLGYVFAFLFYMAAIIFGMQIAQSVVEEKQSRIVEILASAMPINQLLAGKIAGNSALAIGQMALFVIAGLIGVTFTPMKDSLGMIASSSGWFLVFFLVGFLVLSALWAVAGSLATRNEDLQSTATPISTIVVGILFAGLMTSGTTQKILSFVPLTSSVTMPTRIAAGGVPVWEPIVSLLISLAAAWFVIQFAARIYRRSMMQTGKRLSMREAMALED